MVDPSVYIQEESIHHRNHGTAVLLSEQPHSSHLLTCSFYTCSQVSNGYRMITDALVGGGGDCIAHVSFVTRQLVAGASQTRGGNCFPLASFTSATWQRQVEIISRQESNVDPPATRCRTTFLHRDQEAYSRARCSSSFAASRTRISVKSVVPPPMSHTKMV